MMIIWDNMWLILSYVISDNRVRITMCSYTTKMYFVAVSMPYYYLSCSLYHSSHLLSIVQSPFTQTPHHFVIRAPLLTIQIILRADTDNPNVVHLPSHRPLAGNESLVVTTSGEIFILTRAC